MKIHRAILVMAPFLVLMKTAVSVEDNDPMDPPPPIEPCRDVFVSFSPCMGFVEGIYRQPSPDCCRGVSHLNNVVRFTAPGTIHGNRETGRVCACIEIMANANHLPFLPSAISNLPLRCSLTLSFPISIAMDCSQFRNTKVLDAEISN
ncbi:PREDICTED: protein ARABIDOPSIS THALIANA ANTHER 7-like [Camelina sativa]|uniref:Protein ARABIDOPSIS THALIANA ANTHER 7-like n=1 Tax=Camelina sativa TaxID=90675 RepID=A0ABM0UAW2_CAMSA|nr:PREDICTED: protein ARABIDOPSIS THALIANA ANTHER 7-like [Camelina sativa]